MPKMLIDGIRALTMHGNVVRVHCTTVGLEGKQEDSGTLLIPGNEVNSIMQTLISGLQEMQKQIKERAASAPGTEPPKAN